MLHYTDEIRRGVAAEAIYCRPTVDYAELSTPDVGKGYLTVYSPVTRAVLIDGAEMTWVSGKKRFEIDIDTTDSDDWPTELNYRADVTFTYDSNGYHRLFYFDVLNDPWRPNLATNDLLVLAPVLSYEEEGANADFSDIIMEAEEELRLHLRTRGISPGLIRNKAALNRCHRLLSTSLLYLRSAYEADSGRWAKYLDWRSQFECGLKQMLSRLELDLDQDNQIDLAVLNRSGVRLRP